MTIINLCFRFSDGFMGVDIDTGGCVEFSLKYFAE